jgi:N-acetylneuraminic acid mutarotase
VLYNPSTGTWSQTTGSLATQRDSAAAVLLPNGKVLIAGGVNFGGYTTGAEIYDPSTGTWMATGNLNDDLGYETATLLNNGQVLIAGGIDDNGTISTAELYDPSSGTWTNTGSMANARANHTATLLPSGQVLVAGGGNGSNGINSAELYNPGTGTWTATGSLNTAREYHSADLLPNGQVLVEGGSTSTTSLTSAELYNPATGTWTTTGTMTAARQFEGSVLLPDGKVLVTGGEQSSAFLTSAEIYDPATGSWTATGSLANARALMTDTLLTNGQVLIVGGTHDTNTATEIYDPGLGYTSATQPAVNTLASSTLSLGSELSLTGTAFTGAAADLTDTFPNGGPSEASGGNTQSSPSNYPVVKLQSLVNEETVTLPVDETIGFSATSFTSQALPSFPSGYALLTMFVNGTPSNSQIIRAIGKLSQTIPAVTIGNLSYTPNPITLPTFNSSAGLPVTVTVQSGPATITGNQATLTGTGLVTLAANQAGNSDYSAAPQVTTSFTVTKAKQTIPAETIGNLTYTPKPITLPTFNSSAGLPVTVTVQSGPATISGNQATLTGAGRVTLAANQAGNSDYSAAPQVTTSFNVLALSQMITWTPVGNKTAGTGRFHVAANASSGLPVTFSVVSGPATNVGNLITLTGVGTVVLGANQAGNAIYSAAPQATTSFVVNPASK